MKIVIKNGRVLDPATKLDKITDLCIENDCIVAIGPFSPSFSPDKIIDATDQCVIPGLVDLCARPQLLHPHGSTLHNEGNTAIARGITSVCIPPDDEPIMDSTSVVNRLIQQESLTLPHFFPLGALTSQLEGKTVADLSALIQAGCVALTNAQKGIKNLRILRHCYDYAASFDLLVVIQPQDPWLSQDGVAHEGIKATDLGLPGIPVMAETIAIAQHLLLIAQSGVRAHFTCLSSQEGVELIREAKAKGLPVTADTAMHSLYLNEMDIGTFDPNCHLYPPLRSEQDRLGLLAGIQDGTLDAICSDHRPLNKTAKLAPFAETIPGMSTFDTFLSLGIELVNQNKLSFLELVSRMAYQPAQILKLSKGTLTVGGKADICVFDPQKSWTVREQNMLSQGKNTAFYNKNLPGVVTYTLLNGKIIYEG